MGGEKLGRMAVAISVIGSPPRGRGKGGRINLERVLLGITPALAGKSLFCFTAAVPIQDHPRMGGEKTFASRSIICMKGSPPRRRGIVVHKLNGRIIPGITPAWAGKSMTAPGRSSRTGDHPRVGGEKNNHIIDNQYGKGSPPRGRGKARPDLKRRARARITPAQAGKSLVCYSPSASA